MNTDTQNTNDREDPSPMSAVRKFLFDRSFDEEEELDEEEIEEEVEEAEPEVIVPTFSEEEMKAAREEAFASGKEEGINEAAAATEREIVGALEKLGGKFGELFKSQEEADSSILESAISVAVAITRKVFPTLNEQNALKEIERMVTLTMEKILEEPRIIVYVNPELTGPLTERLGGLAEKADYKGEVEVAAADDMPPGDCRVEWSGGGAKRNMDELWQEIDGVVERNLSEVLEADETVEQAPELEAPSPAAELPSEPPSESPSGPGPDGSSETEAGGIDPKDPAPGTADVEPAPEEVILDTDQDETAGTPDAPGPEDTTTDPEDA